MNATPTEHVDVRAVRRALVEAREKAESARNAADSALAHIEAAEAVMRG